MISCKKTRSIISLIMLKTIIGHNHVCLNIWGNQANSTIWHGSFSYVLWSEIFALQDKPHLHRKTPHGEGRQNLHNCTEETSIHHEPYQQPPLPKPAALAVSWRGATESTEPWLPWMNVQNWFVYFATLLVRISTETHPPTNDFMSEQINKLSNEWTL